MSTLKGSFEGSITFPDGTVQTTASTGGSSSLDSGTISNLAIGGSLTNNSSRSIGTVTAPSDGVYLLTVRVLIAAQTLTTGSVISAQLSTANGNVMLDRATHTITASTGTGFYDNQMMLKASIQVQMAANDSLNFDLVQRNSQSATLSIATGGIEAQRIK